MIDDCALARAVKSSGGRVWLGLSDIAAEHPAYRTFGEIGRMISRTAFTQLGIRCCFGRHRGGTRIDLSRAAPFDARGPARRGSGLGALAWLLMTAAYWPAVRYAQRPWFWAPLLPAIALFYLGATLHSAVAHWRGRGGMWKGRRTWPPRNVGRLITCRKHVLPSEFYST